VKAENRWPRKAALIAVSLGAVAAVTSAFGGSAVPKGNIVTVVATDYAFHVADTIPAGLTTIKLINKGPDFHHVYLVRFAPGRTLADLVEAMKSNPHAMPSWVSDVGGPNTPLPGGESNATLNLTPGRYAMLCVIPAMADGQPHVMKGMMKEITVVPPRGTPASSPAVSKPDYTMTLSDYDFTLSKPLVAGMKRIRVQNNAVQSHEVLLVPGKTPHDVLAFFEKPEGQPPGAPVGGTTLIAQGGWNDIDVNLEKGDYALICFVPDAKDGKPHFVHGMIKQVKVN
jgi:hypothetical protein